MGITPKDEKEQLARINLDQADSYRTNRPVAIIPVIPRWDTVSSAQASNEVVREIKSYLIETKFKSAAFKDLFVATNRHWLKTNIKTVLSPLTLKNRRKEVIDGFRNIYGEYSMACDKENGTEEIHVKKVESTPLPSSIFRKKLPSKTKSLLESWHKDARRRIQIRQKVAGLLEKLASPQCEFCSARWGIRAECMQDFYGLFHRVSSKQSSAELEGME